MSKLLAHKTRGEHKGLPLFPHKHQDGTYVASSSRFEVDYIHVNHEEELEALVRTGLAARMSNPDIPQAPSLIVSKNIIIEDDKPSKNTAISVLPKLAKEASLDIDSRAKSRKEQAFLRAHLAKGKSTAICVLCNKSYPIEFLVAAHIKRRVECTNSEKLDFDNIASLMCKMGCDDLYEKGYIYISEGAITSNLNRATTPDLDIYISKIIGNKVSNWNSSKTYYKYHAKKFTK